MLTPPTHRQSMCNHDNTIVGANQYAQWRKCMKCGLRLAYSSKLPKTATHGVYAVEHISGAVLEEVYAASQT